MSYDDFWTIIRGSAEDMVYGLAGFRRCYTLLLTYSPVLFGEGYQILAGGWLFRKPFHLMLIFLPLDSYSVSYITAESVQVSIGRSITIYGMTINVFHFPSFFVTNFKYPTIFIFVVPRFFVINYKFPTVFQYIFIFLVFCHIL